MGGKQEQIPMFFPSLVSFPSPPFPRTTYMVRFAHVQCEEGVTSHPTPPAPRPRAMRLQSPGQAHCPVCFLPGHVPGHPREQGKPTQTPGPCASRAAFFRIPQPLHTGATIHFSPNAGESPAPQGPASESHLGRPARGKINHGFLSLHASGAVLLMQGQRKPTKYRKPVELVA